MVSKIAKKTLYVIIGVISFVYFVAVFWGLLTHAYNTDKELLSLILRAVGTLGVTIWMVLEFYGYWSKRSETKSRNKMPKV